MSEVEFKACPFCDSEGEEVGLHVTPNPPPPYGDAEWHVQCYGCNVETPVYETRAEAIAAWNRRSPEQVEGLRAAKERLAALAEARRIASTRELEPKLSGSSVVVSYDDLVKVLSALSSGVVEGEHG